MSQFTSEELSHLTKKQLTEIIHGQRECWPGSTFNPSHVRIGEMRAALLDPRNGFLRNGAARDDATARLDNDVHPTNLNAATLSAPTPSSPTPPYPAHPTHVVIHLFLQDRRYNAPRKSAVDISVPITALTDANGKKHVRTQVLFEGLQETLASIKGPAFISCPYHLDSSYTHPIVKWDNGNLEDCSFSSHTLNLTDDHRLTIYVDMNDTDAPPVAMQTNIENTADPTVIWLKEQLFSSPGFSNFEAQHGRRIQNAEIVKEWSFASDFYQRFYRQICTVTNKQITRVAIQASLGIGETRLSDALLGSRLAKEYGPGGARESATVANELIASRTVPLGRSALLKFLTSWEEREKVVNNST